MKDQRTALSSDHDCYIRMEQSYREALSRITSAKQRLREELRTCTAQKGGSLLSAQHQKELEQRIQLLTDEYGELCEALHAIAPYARRQEEGCL